jgi:hypothetical protein
VHGQHHAQAGGRDDDPGFLSEFTGGGLGDVLALLVMAGREAELAGGIQPWGSAEQQDLATTTEDDVGVDDAGVTVRQAVSR